MSGELNVKLLGTDGVIPCISGEDQCRWKLEVRDDRAAIEREDVMAGLVPGPSIEGISPR